MFNVIVIIATTIFGFLLNLVNKLTPEVKEKIIESIVDAFVEIFCKYYQRCKESK